MLECPPVQCGSHGLGLLIDDTEVGPIERRSVQEMMIYAGGVEWEAGIVAVYLIKREIEKEIAAVMYQDTVGESRRQLDCRRQQRIDEIISTWNDHSTA